MSRGSLLQRSSVSVELAAIKRLMFAPRTGCLEIDDPVSAVVESHQGVQLSFDRARGTMPRHRDRGGLYPTVARVDRSRWQERNRNTSVLSSVKFPHLGIYQPEDPRHWSSGSRKVRHNLKIETAPALFPEECKVRRIKNPVVLAIHGFDGWSTLTSGTLDSGKRRQSSLLNQRKAARPRCPHRLTLDLFKRKAMLVCSCKQPLSWAKHDSQYTSRLCFASSSLPKSNPVHFVNQYFCLLIMAARKWLPTTSWIFKRSSLRACVT